MFLPGEDCCLRVTAAVVRHDNQGNIRKESINWGLPYSVGDLFHLYHGSEQYACMAGTVAKTTY